MSITEKSCAERYISAEQIVKHSEGLDTYFCNKILDIRGKTYPEYLLGHFWTQPWECMGRVKVVNQVTQNLKDNQGTSACNYRMIYRHWYVWLYYNVDESLGAFLSH